VAFLLLATTLGLAGCSTADGSARQTESTDDLSEGTATMPTGDIDPGLRPYIDIAIADLAERLAVAADAITVESATLVVWPDSALGCPAPGQEYAKVATDGAQILLNAQQRQYRYHAGGSRTPFLCEKAGPVAQPNVTLAP
jgi:hypothetical protein